MLHYVRTQSQLMREHAARLSRGEPGVAPPVVNFQAGRVGSASMHRALHRLGYSDGEEDVPSKKCVYHTHSLDPSFIAESFLHNMFRPQAIQIHQIIGLYIHRYYISPKAPIRYITIVRDPVARNISGLFYNWRSHAPDETYLEPTDANIQWFLDYFFEKLRQNVLHHFFGHAFPSATGINLYDHPFPKAHGAAVVVHPQRPHQQVLVYKTEIPDERIEAAAAAYLNEPGIKLTRQNQASDFAYKPIYDRFKAALHCPQEYLDKMLDTPLMRHFYTDEEIEALYQKYS